MAKRNLGGRELPAYPSTWSIAGALKAKHDITVTPQTVLRDLKAVGFKCFSRQKVPFYASDIKTIHKRDKFSNNLILVYTPKQLREDYVFSDEHMATSNDHSLRTQWASKRGNVSRRERKAVRNAIRTLVWAAIGHNYKSPLIFVDTSKDPITKKARRQTSATYTNNCLTASGVLNHLKAKKKTFMQDGASPHTAKATKKFLAEKGVKVLEDWAPYSPCLNPIEDLWALLERRRSERFAPAKTEAELKGQLKKIWDGIPQSTINKYVASFETKVRRCAKAKGRF